MKLGIVLGAAANSGLNTYRQLEDEKRKQEEFERKQKEWQAEDQAMLAIKGLPKPGEYKLDGAMGVDKLYTDKLGLSGDALKEALAADTTPDAIKTRLAGKLAPEELGKYNFTQQGGSTYAHTGALPKMSENEYTAAMADAYTKTGHPTMMQKGLALRGLAQQVGKGDIELNRELYADSVMTAGRRQAAGDTKGAVEALTHAYKFVPDGREVGNVSVGKKGDVSVEFVDKTTGQPVGTQKFKSFDEALTRAAAMKDTQTWTQYNQFVTSEDNKMRIHRESQALQAKLHGPQAELANLELQKKKQVFGLINQYNALLNSPESWRNVDQLKAVGSQIEALDPSTVKTYNRVNANTGEVETGTIGSFTGNLDKLKPKQIGDGTIETVQTKLTEAKTPADIETLKSEINRNYGRGAWETYIEPRMAPQIQAITEGKSKKSSALPSSAAPLASNAALPEWNGKAVDSRTLGRRAFDTVADTVVGGVRNLNAAAEKRQAENVAYMLKSGLESGQVNDRLLDNASQLMVKYPEYFSQDVQQWLLQAQLNRKAEGIRQQR